jgi:periplasmic protein CpxP/Spy
MAPLRNLALLALVASVFAGAAQAQTQPRAPDLHQLHDALNLSAAQEPAWNTFQAAMQPDPNQEARDRSAGQMMPGLHAPQRVDLTIAAMQADLEDLQRRGAAVKAFYSTLSAAQQAVFDRQTAAPQRE